MKQNCIDINGNYAVLDKVLLPNEAIFVVCGNSVKHMGIYTYLKNLEKKVPITYFTDFSPNPSYESVVSGVRVFQTSKAKVILAIGGGSAVDVAKCIKLFSNMSSEQSYLEQQVIPNDIQLIAMPTTAGTGSESTKYAVIYLNGVKQSVTDDSIVPSVIVFDPSTLRTLPDSVRRASMLDALSHAMESYWSLNSTEESKALSEKAIHGILTNKDAYLSNSEAGNAAMLKVSNIAGQAINITQTTAGHAMSYKLTSLYGLQHGFATAVVDAVLWPWMVKNINHCIDSRGQEYLEKTFCELAVMFGGTNVTTSIQEYQKIVNGLISIKDIVPTAEEYTKLRTSVNQKRLKNNPVQLDEQAIDEIYHAIFGGQK